MVRWSFIIILLLGHGVVARNHEVDLKKVQEIKERARQRLYPGGKDESDLRVQSQLVNPIRKLTPAVEENHQTAEEDDSSTFEAE